MSAERLVIRRAQKVLEDPAATNRDREAALARELEASARAEKALEAARVEKTISKAREEREAIEAAKKVKVAIRDMSEDQLEAEARKTLARTRRAFGLD